jgi:hypothetical protein
MTTGLLEQQRALVEALFAPRQSDAQRRAQAVVVDDVDWRRGLATYRANGLALAHRALSAAYPVLAQLVGEQTFDALARRLWSDAPPARGDVAQWGGALPALLATSADLVSGDAYLPDVARAEWALHQAASAADSPAQPQTFALLAEQPAACLRFQLAPGTHCVASAWPIVSIWRAHREDETLFAIARERLAAAQAETALVWRQGLRPRFREAAAGEVAFVAALQETASLADALARAPGFDLGAWLEPAVRDGLLLAVHSRPSPSPP